ncbi:MAG: aminotransferase class IV, partial [Planctomycetes bacterium]|nr:aminotransferase class IV [Planctomycetota bacterium]
KFPRVFINVQGELVPAERATVNLMDHGFLYGDSVYETVRTFQRVPFLLDRHLDRLQRSTDRIFLPLPLSRRDLEAEIYRSIEEAPLDGDVILRVVISRGIGPIGLNIDLCPEPRYFIYVMELLPDHIPESADPERGGGGIRVVISKTRRNSPRALDPSIKSGNFLNNILAYKDARDAQAQEAILCTADGYLAEGTTSNVFVVKGGFIWTPRSEGILDGITRAVLFEECAAAGIPIGETSIPPEALFSADEAFISSSVRGVVPIAEVNDRTIGSGRRGPLTWRLQKLYRARMQREHERRSQRRLRSEPASATGAESAVGET